MKQVNPVGKIVSSGDVVHLGFLYWWRSAKFGDLEVRHGPDRDDFEIPGRDFYSSALGNGFI